MKTQEQIMAFLVDANKITMMIERADVRLWASQYVIWLRDRANGVKRPMPAMDKLFDNLDAWHVRGQLDGVALKHFGVEVLL